MEIKFANSGQSYGINYKIYDIAALDENNVVLAWYSGYYYTGTDSYKLYPKELTRAGKQQGYTMQKQEVKRSQLFKEEVDNARKD